MKQFKFLYTAVIFCIVLLFSACSQDDNHNSQSTEVDNFEIAHTIHQNNHTIELFTKNGKFQTGYNKIYLQIKDDEGSLVNISQPSWMPIMNMMGTSHSCPYSAITKKENTSFLYTGYILFQMANDNMNHWEINLYYTVNGKDYTASDQVIVAESANRTIESFQAVDGKNYVLSMMEPSEPFVGINKMKAIIYQMESMMTFVPVDDYMVIIDPRMPGMGNHSSPNNTNLLPTSNGIYEGNLSLSMTGYWRINLQLADSSSNIIKGEEINAENESSSIYFEIDF